MARTRLGRYIGVVVDGYRLDPADPSAGDYVNELLLEHKVVLFKGQHLDRHAFMEIARRIGRPEIHPFTAERDPVAHGMAPLQPYPEYPEITAVHHDGRYTPDLDDWHSDLNWREAPALACMLRAVRVPPVGGDTCWADMGKAYDSLSDAVRSELEDLRVVHDWARFHRPAGAGDERVLRELREKYPARSHPLVLSHPFTGEKVLFSNGVSGVRVEGVGERESRRVLDLVHRLARVPEFQCRFGWEEGDVAIWDNLAAQHYCVRDHWPHARQLEHIALEGVPIK